jgi:hypothetical protein
MLGYFQNAKTKIFDDFFGFLSVFVIFSKKCDDFRVTTWKYALRPLFSRFSTTRVGSYPTNRPMINADRIERQKIALRAISAFYPIRIYYGPEW